jgi:hypothetical protein
MNLKESRIFTSVADSEVAIKHTPAISNGEARRTIRKGVIIFIVSP